MTWANILTKRRLALWMCIVCAAIWQQIWRWILKSIPFQQLFISHHSSWYIREHANLMSHQGSLCIYAGLQRIMQLRWRCIPSEKHTIHTWLWNFLDESTLRDKMISSFMRVLQTSFNSWAVHLWARSDLILQIWKYRNTHGVEHQYHGRNRRRRVTCVLF